MKIPLSKRLPRREFVNLAELQDRAIDAIYSFDKDFVLHGGTAIWRCYNGNRFSYDIDGYVQSAIEMKLMSHNLTWALSRRGARLDSFRHIKRVAIAQVSDQDTQLKLEFGIKKAPQRVIGEYERTDGTLTSVLTLAPEDLILEKIDAYNGRGYMRDLYDIYHLIGQATHKKRIGPALSKFLAHIAPPTNVSELSTMIYSGVSPTYAGMIGHIKANMK